MDKENSSSSDEREPNESVEYSDVSDNDAARESAPRKRQAQGRVPRPKLVATKRSKLQTYNCKIKRLENHKKGYLISLWRPSLACCQLHDSGKRVSRFWGITHEKENKPEWWPAEVPFSSPNIRERDATEDKPVLEVDQIKVLSEAMRRDIIDKRCNNISHSGKPSSKVDQAMSDETQEEVDPFDIETTDPKESRYSKESFMDEDPPEITSLSPPCLQETVLQAKEYLNSVQAMVGLILLTKWEKWMSPFYGDAGFEKDALIPYGLAPLTATGNGDCLFNSVGKLLFGTEVVSPILRLVAAAEGIRHWRHYVEEANYCYCVDSTFYYHDFRSSTRELNEPINVMFVSVGKSPFPNHYIPLVWKVGKRASAPSLKASVKERMCAASKKLGCHALVGEKEEWVFCKRCKLCYHAVCSGVNANRKSFICCIDEATKDAIKNDINAIAIHFDDTFSILQNTTCQESNVFVADTHHSNDIVEGRKPHHKIFPRDDILAHELVIFPYASRMCTLDSLNPEGCRNDNLMTFAKFINHIEITTEKQVTKFYEIDCKIPVQVRKDDCGVFLLFYIESIMNEEYTIDEDSKLLITDNLTLATILGKKSYATCISIKTTFNS
eukprot:gene3054-3516_t